MPAANKAQRTALIIKKGIDWVRAHGFDKIRGKRKARRGRRK